MPWPKLQAGRVQADGGQPGRGLSPGAVKLLLDKAGHLSYGLSWKMGLVDNEQAKTHWSQEIPAGKTRLQKVLFAGSDDGGQKTDDRKIKELQLLF